MTIKKTLLVFTCCSFLSTAVFASAEKAISSAETAQKAAAKMGYEWRDTGKLIKQAKELAKKGKSAEAIKLANKAEQQGTQAVAQYHAETKRYQKHQ